VLSCRGENKIFYSYFPLVFLHGNTCDFASATARWSSLLFFFVCEGGGCRTHGSGGAAMAVVDPAPVESSRGATTVEGIIVPY